ASATTTGVGTTSTRARTISSTEGVASAWFLDRPVVATRSASAQVARAHQATFHRVEGSLSSALQLELAEDVTDVGLDGLLTDAELAGHLLVCLAFREESKHGRFPFGQDLGAAGNLHIPYQPGGGRRRQVHLGRGRRPDRLRQFVRLRVLEEVADRPAADRPCDGPPPRRPRCPGSGRSRVPAG